MSERKYYWLKLDRQFFKRHDIRIVEAMPNGKDYILFYLKLLCESVSHDGELRFSEAIPYNEQMLSVVTDTNVDVVRAALQTFQQLNMLEVLDDGTLYMTESQKMLGSETGAAERMRKMRQRQTPTPPMITAPKTNAERQRAFRAKQVCSENQHIPMIEDHTNQKRYGGNYYVVCQRERYKCAICESTENLCVHHIDGYDEAKPENNAENKMVLLCRKCHSNIHAGADVPQEVLDRIGYWSSVTESVTDSLRSRYIEKEIEKDIEIDIEKEIDFPWEDTGNQMATKRQPNGNQEKKADAFATFAQDDEEMLTLLKEFEAMRKRQKKPMTDRAKQMLVDKLKSFPEERRKPALEESIYNCWSSVYDHSDKDPKKTAKQKAQEETQKEWGRPVDASETDRLLRLTREMQ